MINKGDAMEAANIELKFYHGTNRKRGQKFIKNQSMEFSKGEKHWLGDGIYLFEDDFWAYWWIRELYKEKYNEIVNSIEEFDFLNKILSYYEILDLLFIDKNPAVYYNYNQKDLYEI